MCFFKIIIFIYHYPDVIIGVSILVVFFRSSLKNFCPFLLPLEVYDVLSVTLWILFSLDSASSALLLYSSSFFRIRIFIFCDYTLYLSKGFTVAKFLLRRICFNRVPSITPERSQSTFFLESYYFTVYNLLQDFLLTSSNNSWWTYAVVSSSLTIWVQYKSINFIGPGPLLITITC